VAEEELLEMTALPGGLFVQRKLQLGSVDDPLEDEADRVADHVMRMPAGPVVQRVCEDCEEPETVSRKPSYAVMRKCSACEEEATTGDRPSVSFIQRQANGDGGSLSDGAANRISATRGLGASMPSETQAFMEQRFGADFSGVSIHAGASDADLSSELNATRSPSARTSISTRANMRLPRARGSICWRTNSRTFCSSVARSSTASSASRR
jgi:hypothetical protein